MHTAQSINGQTRGIASNGPDLASVYQKRDSSPMQTPATDSMPSFDRLLVATDFTPASQAAFRTALENCSSLGASLVILHVCEYPPAGPPDTGGFLIEQQNLCEQCRNGLDELRQRQIATDRKQRRFGCPGLRTGHQLDCSALERSGGGLALDFLHRFHNRPGALRRPVPGADLQPHLMFVLTHLLTL